MTTQGSPGTQSEYHTTDEIWYIALKKLLLSQGPGITPSVLRLMPGQRFTLDGDEPVDIESLLRIRAVKIYEESDAEWAQQQLANAPKPRRRRETDG